MSCSLDAARSFLEQLEARGGREGAVLAYEFSDIRARSASWKTDSMCSTEAGSRPENVRKNRYKDVLPYDKTRVILSLLQEEGHGDYINGNFIRGTDGSQAYIATQGPLPHTLLDFWRLIWEFGVKVILMACQEIENGRKKCERYWAQEQEPLQIGLFCITLTRETWLNADTTLRTLQVTFQKESRSVYQLQYMSWPDRGVPRNPDHMLAMVEEARRLQGSGPSPLCVHCSAGCGRTGVLCTLDYVRQLLLTQMIPPNFSLFSVVLEIRRQRPAAIQTEEQYRFLYHTVAQMFLSALQNASPHYQNLKENCAPLYDDAFSLRTSHTLPATARPSGGVLRSISVPGSPGLAMADTYAVVQKRAAPAGTGTGEGGLEATRTPTPPLHRVRPGHAPEADVLASPATPLGQPPVLWSRPEASRAKPRSLARPPSLGGGLRFADLLGGFLPAVPVDQSPAGPGAYEDVVDGAQTGGLGFNLRIGRPKGPRDPPAEWTRV
ncbi:tyrosine-protein phosphatase non-receptor type 18 [Neophocaena asiaeorientalis asiaeorientalis]|uniref:protein-tyrosine-phosphatase n=1 Tax=Neophocaena asiaeorientalis asiaeorientalis TaxID=1706337 RepID=A0A341BK18_NEOAA|nr:tyrosine-protein phosphatase non-receptor type 18 [Neophocaena asiaeorientalis asiaeorientalis]